MNGPNPVRGRPDYGLDAPGVVRNLFLIAAAGLAVAGSAAAGLWSGWVLGIPVASIGLTFFVAFAVTGGWMVWGSKVGKLRDRERHLNRIAWRGDEAVLDVGCGRGLLLIGAARRVPRGKAVGIDIWQAEDLTGNRPEATLENARREGVADRVEVQTADMRRLPFADGSFDVIVSRAAVHNLYNAADRDQAVAEMARVLKPGGRAVLVDIRHLGQYAAAFERNGCDEVRRVGPWWQTLLTAALTWGALRAGTVVARKTAAPPAEPGAAT
jgi:arsenite methyltransferase